MKLSNLKTGMQVELRDGFKFTIFRDIHTANIYDKQSILLVGDSSFIPGENYNEDLTHVEAEMFDIVKVFKGPYIYKLSDFCFKSPGHFLIWERPSKPNYTELQNQAGFKIGDFVSITRRITDKEKIAIGWELEWIDCMNKAISHYGKITDIYNCGIRVSITEGPCFPDYKYPFIVLKKVGHES